jgi:hypothetical protein
MRVQIRGKACGEPFINTFGFSIVNPLGTFVETAAQLADEFNTALDLFSSTGPWLLHRSVQYTVESLAVLDVSPGVAAQYELAIGFVGNIDDEDALPPNDCLRIKWQSDFRGPGGRGRNYLNGYTEGSQVAGFWIAETQSGAQAIAEALLAAFGELGAGSARLCVLHGVTGGVPIVPPEVKPVMSYSVSNEVRSIGRRAIGRRIHRTPSAP